MDSVNKTLFIPLYGKALVSRRGILLSDPKAEAIWADAGFPLGRKSRSKWLAFHMAMRASVFDRYADAMLAQYPDAAVLHLGCGLDSRITRIAHGDARWYDVDFPAVIDQRRRYYIETANYRMIGGDLRDADWLEEIPRGGTAVILLEGVSMYLGREALEDAITRWRGHFDRVFLLMDCYSEFAARASRIKNPVNEVGVTQVYGMDSPELDAIGFFRAHEMTPPDLIAQLKPGEQFLFRRLYAGAFARKLYKIYEYRG